MSEPGRLSELRCSYQSAHPLDLRHPDNDHDDNDQDHNHRHDIYHWHLYEKVDDDDNDSDNENEDDLDMHPEPGHDSVAGAQTSLCKLGLGAHIVIMVTMMTIMTMMIMITKMKGTPLPGLSYGRCQAHRPKQSAPDQA